MWQFCFPKSKISSSFPHNRVNCQRLCLNKVKLKYPEVSEFLFVLADLRADRLSCLPRMAITIVSHLPIRPWKIICCASASNLVPSFRSTCPYALDYAFAPTGSYSVVCFLFIPIFLVNCHDLRQRERKLTKPSHWVFYLIAIGTASFRFNHFQAYRNTSLDMELLH